MKKSFFAKVSAIVIILLTNFQFASHGKVNTPNLNSTFVLDLSHQVGSLISVIEDKIDDNNTSLLLFVHGLRCLKDGRSYFDLTSLINILIDDLNRNSTLDKKTYNYNFLKEIAYSAESLSLILCLMSEKPFSSEKILGLTRLVIDKSWKGSFMRGNVGENIDAIFQLAFFLDGESIDKCLVLTYILELLKERGEWKRALNILKLFSFDCSSTTLGEIVSKFEVDDFGDQIPVILESSSCTWDPHLQFLIAEVLLNCAVFSEKGFDKFSEWWLKLKLPLIVDFVERDKLSRGFYLILEWILRTHNTDALLWALTKGVEARNQEGSELSYPILVRFPESCLNWVTKMSELRIINNLKSFEKILKVSNSNKETSSSCASIPFAGRAD